jgi:hypothetical protein
MQTISTTRRVRRKAPLRPVVFDRRAEFLSIAVSDANDRPECATGVARQAPEIDNSLREATHG